MKFYAFSDSDTRAANTEKHSPLENGSVSVSVSASVRLDTSRLSRVALVCVRALVGIGAFGGVSASHILSERERARVQELKRKRPMKDSRLSGKEDYSFFSKMIRKIFQSHNLSYFLDSCAMRLDTTKHLFPPLAAHMRDVQARVSTTTTT